MKKLLIAAAIALGGCAPQDHVPTRSEVEATRRDVVAHVEMCTIALVRQGPDGEVEPYCGGVWIGPTKILTALHCVLGEDGTLWVQASSAKEPVWAEFLAGDVRTDLALLETSSTNRHLVARLPSKEPLSGDPVHIVGHTQGFPWTYASGAVAAVRSHAVGPRGGTLSALQISAPVWFGNSGGGAWNETGELIGISSWVSVKGPGLAFFVAPLEIRRFLYDTM